MHFLVEGGGHLEAASPLALVEALRADAATWAPSVSIEDYMEEAARRAQTQTGYPVRTTSVREFVADLLTVGLVKPYTLGQVDPAGVLPFWLQL